MKPSDTRGSLDIRKEREREQGEREKKHQKKQPIQFDQDQL